MLDASETHQPGVDRAFGATVLRGELLRRHAGVEVPQQRLVFFRRPRPTGVLRPLTLRFPSRIRLDELVELGHSKKQCPDHLRVIEVSRNPWTPTG